jgi:LPS-assembly protein
MALRNATIFFIALPMQLLFSVCSIANENLVPTAPHTPATTFDWVHQQDMSPEQRAHLGTDACGAFIDPIYSDDTGVVALEDTPLRVNADSTRAMASGHIVNLQGQVEISQGKRQLQSDKAQIDHKGGKVFLEGNIKFREPGLLLMGKNANIDTANRNLTIEEATYVIHEASAIGSAKRLQRSEQGTIIIDEASYSTCGPNQVGWKLVTKQIEIDQKSGWATVQNARFDVRDVPVFYFPYFKFPIDNRRTSGLLIPDININQENGIDYNQPVYWNMAENYDAIISPRFIQHRGFGIEGEFRYLNEWSTSKLSTAFLGGDKGGNNDDDIDPATGLHAYEGDNRYRLELTHLGGAHRPWSTYIDYNRVSDLDYVRDLGNMVIDETSKTHLQQYAHASYETEHWTYQIASNDYQVITQGLKEHYSVLPKISVDGHYRIAENISINLRHQYANFKHPDKTRVEGDRKLINYSVAWNKYWRWGFFKPQFQFKYLSYDLSQLETAQNPSLELNPEISTPVFSLDAGVFFERNLNWNKDFLQTLEPRIFYLDSSYKDQSALPDFDTREHTLSYDSFFRDTRFVGGDRISDDNRITLGFTTQFIDRSSGRQAFYASIAQSIYFKDRRVALNSKQSIKELFDNRREKSQIAIEMGGRVGKNWRLVSDFIYSEANSQFEKVSLGAHYNDKKKRLFNFSYRYTNRADRNIEGQTLEQSINQGNISAFIPLSSSFNLVGRWNHDFTNNRELEVFAGFEYNNCCWRASLIAFRSLRRDDELLFPERDLSARNGVAFKIEFKGLGGSGRRVDTMLNNGIFGYEQNNNF